MTPRCGPIAVTPYGRRLFFVLPGDTLRPELSDELGILRHGRGSWVPAPPTREPAGRVQWQVSPAEVDWHLPRSYQVQDLLVAALDAMSRPGRRQAERRPERWPTNPAHKSLSGAYPAL